MLQKTISYILQMNMISEGDRIVAGISGGADSVCLFYVLLELQKKLPFEFCVVHVNHGIRAEAGEDEAYVEQICKEQGIAFYPVKKCVPSIAKELRIGEEEAGRRVRYEAFSDILSKVYGGNGKIAVAHTQNDRAETFLFHLFRGTGLNGLTGIAPVRDSIIRPLLCVEREEIEAWLKERDISYRTDITNESDAYARNRLRHHILPYADREICHGTVAHINKAADLIGQAMQYLDRQTKEAYGEMTTCSENGIHFQKDIWEQKEPYIRQSVVHEAFKRLTPAAKDITALHVEQVCELFEKQVGRSLDLPYRIRAVRDYQGVLLVRQGKEQPIKQNTDLSTGQYDVEDACEEEFPKKESEKEQMSVRLEGTQGSITFDGYRVCFRVFPNVSGERILTEIPKNDFTKWFDYDKINKPVVMRYRKAADVIAVTRQGGTKTVKAYMIHEKIPAKDRGSIPLFAEDKQVIWIVGHRISEYYKISPQTKNIIEIQILGGKRYG